MASKRAEIIPAIGLGGLLLGQSATTLEWQERWQESPAILRGTLVEGAILVTVDVGLDQIVGLEAHAGYDGELPEGLRVGMPFEEALRRQPGLRPHDMLAGYYEAERLGYLLQPDDFDGSSEELGKTPIGAILVCDWAHDYWTFARPLLHEEDYDT